MPTCSGQLFVYMLSLGRCGQVYVREVSMVPVYALLLFGGAMSVQHEQGCIQLDGWASFQAPAKIAALVGARLQSP